MCEPYHSIVQYPDDDGHGGSGSSGGSAPTGRLGMMLGKTGKFLKRIRGFWHASKMGAGHSGTLEGLGVMQLDLMPDHLDYEAAWWDRSFRRDWYGHCNVERFLLERGLDGEEATEVAKQYAEKSSIGSLHALRQFLEASMRKTDNLDSYVRQFREILNKKGRSNYERRLDALASQFGIDSKRFIRIFDNQIGDQACESLIRLCLGYTRKRHLLVPEWADDGALWTPPTSKGVKGSLRVVTT